LDLTVTYTGDSTPDTRTLPGLEITKLSVGEMDNNVYLLTCTATGQRLMIDAAAEPAKLLVLIGDGGLSAVVTTHRHGDHWGALADVLDATGARAIAGRPDLPDIPGATEPVDDGGTVAFGDVTLEVISIVGHTPGSITLVYRDPAPGGIAHLWTGDSLFPGGVGGTWGDKDAFESLIGDVEHKLFDRFGDDTWFYPGHGKDSTLGAERAALPEWRERGW
jgi:glyoxylase-like metal-dependent hydrolase (beta-lactamase superfamily II)